MSEDKVEKEYGLQIEKGYSGTTVIKRCPVCDDGTVWTPNVTDTEKATKIVERRFAELHLECSLEEVF